MGRAGMPGLATNGLSEPEEVREATNTYRANMDIIGQFIEDCCFVNPSIRAKASSLYAAYIKWCEDGRETPLTQRDFGSAMSERGFLPKKSNSINWWRGIGLPDPSDSSENAKNVESSSTQVPKSTPKSSSASLDFLVKQKPENQGTEGTDNDCAGNVLFGIKESERIAAYCAPAGLM